MFWQYFLEILLLIKLPTWLIEFIGSDDWLRYYCEIWRRYQIYGICHLIYLKLPVREQNRLKFCASHSKLFWRKYIQYERLLMIVNHTGGRGSSIEGYHAAIAIWKSTLFFNSIFHEHVHINWISNTLSSNYIVSFSCNCHCWFVSVWILNIETETSICVHWNVEIDIFPKHRIRIYIPKCIPIGLNSSEIGIKDSFSEKSFFSL